MILVDYEAWRCPARDKFPEGPSVFCPIQGCTLAEGCARDRGWLPSGPIRWEDVPAEIQRLREDLEKNR
jgi:hypothetical protein